MEKQNQIKTSSFFGSMFSDFTSKLNLGNPGTYENMHREAKEVFTSNYLINGARIDMTKGFSEKFQVNHSFSLGDTCGYTFISLYASGPWFLQANIDGSGSLSTRLNYEHSKNLRSKAQIQINNMTEPAMVQLESDYTGPTNSFNFKLVNGDVASQTGIACASFLQSVTDRLSAGVESVFQRPNQTIEDSILGYSAKYNFKNNGIFTLQYQPGLLASSYFRKVGETTSLATELQLAQNSMNATQVNLAVGAKFDFRQSTLRSTIESSGKVSTVLENRLSPAISFTISGELDHKKGNSKMGLGFMFAT